MPCSQASQKNIIEKLQLIQNSAARLLTKTRKMEHITPVLAELHWLPVSYRIHFKVLLLVFKAVNGLAPCYITDALSSYTPARALRSADAGLLRIPDAPSKRIGESAFSYYAPKRWNALPQHIREAESIDIFKRQQKDLPIQPSLHLTPFSQTPPPRPKALQTVTDFPLPAPADGLPWETWFCLRFLPRKTGSFTHWFLRFLPEFTQIKQTGSFSSPLLLPGDTNNRLRLNELSSSSATGLQRLPTYVHIRAHFNRELHSSSATGLQRLLTRAYKDCLPVFMQESVCYCIYLLRHH